ncbi:hypothetical protein QNI23_011770 [Bermanella sp. WJH001]|uniref:hypothetical protein n=1 Tax=Bermanella sp. WJH001 TaxID=3048005 RepID=UPI0024BE5C0A|nr:hypothetical protein [Bermanella sp. WJH001]MDJ1537669.1 hypothetical protein [Bermanella sp. WJH001]
MKIIMMLLMLFVTICVQAKDKTIRLEGIKIKADHEAPQVMHIIPWQNPEGAERLYSPVRGAEIERLKPMDPYSFELETTLHEQWQANKNTAIDLAHD